MSVIARFCSAEQMRLISANYLTVLSASHGNHNFNHHLWAKDDRVPIMRWYDSGSVCWNVAWSKKGQYKHQPAIQTPTRQRGLCCKEQTKPLLTDVRDKSMLHCRTLNLQHMVCKVCYQGIVGLRLLWALRNRHSGERLHPSATRARLQFTAPDSRRTKPGSNLDRPQKVPTQKKVLVCGPGWRWILLHHHKIPQAHDGNHKMSWRKKWILYFASCDLTSVQVTKKAWRKRGNIGNQLSQETHEIGLYGKLGNFENQKKLKKRIM